MPGRSLSRRMFLQSSGLALGLPLLDAMTPAFARSPVTEPRRMLLLAVITPRRLTWTS
jgi:hypothetical protein